MEHTLTIVHKLPPGMLENMIRLRAQIYFVVAFRKQSSLTNVLDFICQVLRVQTRIVGSLYRINGDQRGEFYYQSCGVSQGVKIQKRDR